MKFAFVLAAVALCAVAVEMPKLPKFPKFSGKALRDDVKFVQTAPLGCFYEVEYVCDVSDITRDEEAKIEGGEIRYGRDLMGWTQVELEMYGVKVKMETTTLSRADIPEDGKDKSAAIFEVTKTEVDGNKTYDCEMIGYSDPYYAEFENISGVYGMLHLGTYPYTYHEETTLNNETVDAYFYGNDEGNYTYFINGDKHLVSVVADTEDRSAVWVFTKYKDDSKKKDFAIDKKYDGCSAFEKAYEEPPRENDVADCKPDASTASESNNGSSGSAASTVKAAAVAVAMVMVAALF